MPRPQKRLLALTFTLVALAAAALPAGAAEATFSTERLVAATAYNAERISDALLGAVRYALAWVTVPLMKDAEFEEPVPLPEPEAEEPTVTSNVFQEIDPLGGD